MSTLPTNPQGTQIWGDRDLANGCPPIRTGAVNPCASPRTTSLRAGDVVYTRNEVPIKGNNGNYFRDPDSDCKLWPTDATLRDHCFDGRDKIGSTFPLAVSRAAWADGSGSLLAGALEVSLDLRLSGPGRDPRGPGRPERPRTARSMFEYSALYIMGGEGGAKGQVTPPRAIVRGLRSRRRERAVWSATNARARPFSSPPGPPRRI